MSWRVLITAQAMVRSGQPALARLRHAGLELIFPLQSRLASADDLRQLLGGVDAVIAGVEPYTDELLSSPALAPLKIISRWGVGFDAIDIPSATANGILVAYTPGLLNEAVADYAFSLLCSLARRIHTGHAELSQGRWLPSWGHNIHGKTLGLIGCGRIGLAMARRASGFGMRVLASDPTPSEAATALGITFLPLNDVLAQSDFVSVHAASTPETRGLLNEVTLRRMKPSAYLINTARGALIDEAALSKVLKEGHLTGAALDTFLSEPLPAGHPFLGTPNLLLTPHQASFAQETGSQVSDAAAQAVLDAAMGRAPRWLVDPDCLHSRSLRVTLDGVQSTGPA